MPQITLSLEQYRRMSKAEQRQPKRKNVQHEHHQQATFFDILRLNQREFPFLQFIYAVPNAAVRGKKERFSKLAEGLRAGVPDIVFPFQRRGYPGAYLENKFGRNALTPEQLKFKTHLEAEGYCFKTCRAVEQQIEFCEWYLGIELTK